MLRVYWWLEKDTCRRGDVAPERIPSAAMQSRSSALCIRMGDDGLPGVKIPVRWRRIGEIARPSLPTKQQLIRRASNMDGGSSNRVHEHAKGTQIFLSVGTMEWGHTC
jgi:hypothetical protein